MCNLLKDTILQKPEVQGTVRERKQMFSKVVSPKKMTRWMVTVLLCLFAMVIASSAQGGEKPITPISWDCCLNQWPEFYGSNEAIRIADNVLLYQRNTGGWQKGIDMAAVLSEEDKTKLRKDKSKKDSTLDNGATITQLRYLAKVYNATRLERFRQALLKGIDYLLKAQYPNGGWPQFYPWQGHPDYSRYITFNDGAMIGAMSILHDIAKKKPEYTFVGQNRRRKAEKAVQKGIECILKCQIIVNSKRTAWCQQYDQKTLDPRPARIYEKISNCCSESTGIVKFLMDIDNPDPKIIQAVQSAVAWFDSVKLTGIRMVKKPNESLKKGFDNVVVEDADAPPIWARFCQLETNQPIFCGRDGNIKYRLAEIEHERRIGYTWYGYWPAELLAKDYPEWQKKWAPQKNVLKN
jgi:PelA/Pel-15E family pectate lyase